MYCFLYGSIISFFHFSHNEIPNHSTKHTNFKISCKFRIGIPVWLLSHISVYNGTKQKEVPWITWINIYACFICPTSSPSIKCRNFTIECARLLDMMQINLNPIICYTPHNTICLVEAALQMIRKKLSKRAGCKNCHHLCTKALSYVRTYDIEAMHAGCANIAVDTRTHEKTGRYCITTYDGWKLFIWKSALY